LLLKEEAMSTIDNTAEVLPVEVRAHWDGTALTFAGIVYGTLVAVVALLFSSSSFMTRAIVATVFVLVAIIVFGPLRFG